jgi:predicted acylesterase/phospholipase RssA
MMSEGQGMAECSQAECHHPLAPEPDREEIRVALALNGGVSLAVWMGGCAVELDRARRAGSQQPSRIYDVLCECFKRRLVIDILSGTSAGGINGALLGAAMSAGRRLDPGFVRDCWIDLGDMGALLHSTNEESPTALMNGQKFHQHLSDIFKAVLGTDESVRGFGESALPEDAPARGMVPSLDITMTDVIGVERRFRDYWGGELIAREHRPRFQFRESQHFTPEALADAARTTASFPVAFEPWRISGDSRILAGLSRPTYAIDGGLLDNAPIRCALDLIPTKTATTVVRRYFCYVNADPTLREDDPSQTAPTLPQVGGYTFGLPRSAPLVDQLYAIRDAVERPRRSSEIQKRLLRIDLRQLEGMAEVLFDGYVERRTLESLEELVTEPSDANAMYDLLNETGGQLPWIPRRWNPGREGRWEWGVRPAQRILHLLLDLLRPRIAEAKEEERNDLLLARITIEKQLLSLRETRETVVSTKRAAIRAHFDEEAVTKRVDEAAKRATEAADGARRAVEAGVEALRACMASHPDLFVEEEHAALFGSPRFGREKPTEFFRRVLAIEVVRRSLAAEADIESAEQLHFVQLTPEAPSPIFTAHPLRLAGPASTAQKLTGVGLGHFAGFFRRSWRANDYMWGRLDAAARIVDLFLDEPPRELRIATGEDARSRAAKLAEALVACCTGNDWLLEEVLAEADEKTDPSLELATRLQHVIEPELTSAETGEPDPLRQTKVLLQRAAQLEVLEDELPVLRKESKRDRELGGGAEPIDLGVECDNGNVKGGVEAVRALHRESKSLPEELTAKGEAVSDLGLQTITHAAFVSLSAVRTAGMPMAKIFGLVRPPLLGVAGTVAAKWLPRFTALVGFWAASIFLTGRAVAESGGAELDFDAVWSPQTLVMVAAVLGVIGFLTVPVLRLRDGVTPFKNGVYALLLLLAGGGLAVALAMIVQGLSIERVIFAPGVEPESDTVLWVVLFAIGLSSAARLPQPGLPGWLGGLLDKLRSRWMLPILIAAFVAVAVVSFGDVWDGLDGALWRKIAAVIAIGGAPLAAGLAVSIWELRKGPKKEA